MLIKWLYEMHGATLKIEYLLICVPNDFYEKSYFLAETKTVYTYELYTPDLCPRFYTVLIMSHPTKKDINRHYGKVILPKAGPRY